jgi:hypothetical protein
MSDQTHLRDPRWDEEQTSLSDHDGYSDAEEEDPDE